MTASVGAADDAEQWKGRANCAGADTGVFYPARGLSNETAKQLCSACPVRHDCLEFAIAAGERFGVWGGLGERERRRLTRRRQAASRSVDGAASASGTTEGATSATVVESPA